MNSAMAERYHEAAKLIEANGIEGYKTCFNRFGQDIADALMVAWLRRRNTETNALMSPEKVIEQVNIALIEHGILKDRPNEERALVQAAKEQIIERYSVAEPVAY